VEGFCLNKLHELYVKELHHVEVSYRYTTFENLHTEVDINGVLEIVREYPKFSQRMSTRIL
jgi:hypothetical protein